MPHIQNNYNALLKYSCLICQNKVNGYYLHDGLIDNVRINPINQLTNSFTL